MRQKQPSLALAYAFEHGANTNSVSALCYEQLFRHRRAITSAVSRSPFSRLFHGPHGGLDELQPHRKLPRP